MTGKEKAHGNILADIRALIESDPFLNEFTPRMLAQCAVLSACCIALIAVLLFAAKGWVVTWM